MICASTKRYTMIVNTLHDAATIVAGDKSISVVAEWDTGATKTAISKAVVAALGLHASGTITVHTPSTKSEGVVVNTYEVTVRFANGVEFRNLTVTDSHIGELNIGLLVGMDIITKGDFAISNYQGKTTYTYRFPSQAETDYVKEAEEQQNND